MAGSGIGLKGKACGPEERGDNLILARSISRRPHPTDNDGDCTQGEHALKITVISPHRDDAAFSLGLAIGRWVDAGHTVEVMNCFTRSEYSPFGEQELVHANDLREFVSAVRLKEDLRWSRAYKPGRVTLTDVNLRDAPQRRNCRVDEVCSVAVNEEDPALAKIGRALNKTSRSTVLLPLGVGGHVDHLTARLAGVRALPEGTAVAFYEDLPYAARVGMDGAVEERVAEIGGLTAGFVSPENDVAEAVARKRRLALFYDSQIDSDVVEQIAEFCVRYGGRERLWGGAAWCGTEGLGWQT